MTSLAAGFQGPTGYKGEQGEVGKDGEKVKSGGVGAAAQAVAGRGKERLDEAAALHTSPARPDWSDQVVWGRASGRPPPTWPPGEAP